MRILYRPRPSRPWRCLCTINKKKSSKCPRPSRKCGASTQILGPGMLRSWTKLGPSGKASELFQLSDPVNPQCHLILVHVFGSGIVPRMPRFSRMQLGYDGPIPTTEQQGMKRTTEGECNEGPQPKKVRPRRGVQTVNPVAISGGLKDLSRLHF